MSSNGRTQRTPGSPESDICNVRLIVCMNLKEHLNEAVQFLWSVSGLGVIHCSDSRLDFLNKM